MVREQATITRREFLGRRNNARAGTPVIGDTCLLRTGIVCQACVDACEPRALRYDMRGGRVGKMVLSAPDCTRCGDCVPVCPAEAITLDQDASRYA